MDRVQIDMAADLSRQLDKVDTGSFQSAGKKAGSGGQAVEVKDTVTISRQARELAARAGGNRSAQIRYVPATGTVLMPGQSTTVKINVTG
jgi:hypothetical protein